MTMVVVARAARLSSVRGGKESGWADLRVSDQPPQDVTSNASTTTQALPEDGFWVPVASMVKV